MNAAPLPAPAELAADGRAEGAQDPRNAMLDLLEQQVRALIEAGCEPQVRARLARLLPPPERIPASVDRLTGARILTALRAARQARLTEGERAANRSVRDIVLRWTKSEGDPS